MDYILTNGHAILLATGVGLAISILYAMATRQAVQRRAVRLVGLFVTAAIAEFWLASILAGALILAPVQAGAWTIAIGTAVVIWIGFVLPALLVTDVFRGASVSNTIGDCAHWLAVMMIQAATLQIAGLVRPGASM